MAINRGVTPIDPLTDVGKFRLTYGDTQYTPLDPPELGYGNYTELSDDEIELFLAQSSGSVPGAIGRYYVRLSGDAAKQSVSIKDHDLAEDSTKRAADLRATAQWWFDLAEGDDVLAGSADIFDVVGPPLQDGCNCIEGMGCRCVYIL